jgi:hypothetical protein
MAASLQVHVKSEQTFSIPGGLYTVLLLANIYYANWRQFLDDYTRVLVMNETVQRLA